MQIDLAEAARRLAELVRAAQSGEPVTITTPGGLIRLEPVGQAPTTRAPAFGSMEGSVRMSDDFDGPCVEARADLTRAAAHPSP